MWPKNHGEKKQSHNATTPRSFSLAKRLGTAGISSPGLGPVSGLMSYVLPCKCGQLFSPLRASGSSAESKSYEKVTCFFLPAQCLPGSPSESGSMASLSGHSTCSLPGHQEAGLDRDRLFPRFPPCDPSLKMRSDSSFLTPFIYHFPCPVSPVASGTAQLAV